MKKIFPVFLIVVLFLCSCQAVQEDASGETCDVRPMIYYEGTYWVNPHMPVSDLPEGYEYAGTVDEKMAYNTGLEGTEYYTNPESKDFYTYQKTGTPIGGNTVDNTKMAMHYVQWVPMDN